MTETRRHETRSRRRGRPSFSRFTVDFFTRHWVTKVISLLFGFLVWHLIDRQLVGDLFLSDQVVVTMQDPGSNDSDRQNLNELGPTLVVEAPPNWILMGLEPRRVGLRIVGPNEERSLLKWPLRAVLREGQLIGNQSTSEIVVVVEEGDIELPGLTEPAIYLTQSIKVRVSPRQSRDFALRLSDEDRTAGWKARFDPPTVTVQGARARFDALGESNLNIQLHMRPEERAGERLSVDLSAARIDGSLQRQHPAKFKLGPDPRIRMTLSPPEQERRSLILERVAIKRTEVDPLIELGVTRPPFTSVTLEGPADQIARIEADEELRGRLAETFIAVAELDRPLLKKLQTRQNGAQDIGKWHEVVIDGLYISPPSLEKFRQDFPGLSEIQVRDPRSFSLSARLRGQNQDGG